MHHLMLSFWNFIFSPIFVDCTFTPKLNKTCHSDLLQLKIIMANIKHYTECFNALELFKRCQFMWKRVLRSFERHSTTAFLRAPWKQFQQIASSEMWKIVSICSSCDRTHVFLLSKEQLFQQFHYVFFN